MGNQSKISAAIIAFNEQKNIERCLESLQDVVDEIVVIDSGSTDGTQELAKKWGAVVSYHAFEGHIQQKNYAITQCSNDWVVSLDADEAFSKELRSKILDLKKSLDPKKVYALNRLNNYCGKWIKHCGWYPEYRVRLFRKESGAWGGDNPHDEFLPKDDFQVERIKENLHHYSYYTLEEHDAQMEKFTTIAANTYYQKGKKSSIFKQIFSPIFIFLRTFIIQMGIFDGRLGWEICKRAAKTTYLKYKKLAQLQAESK